MIRSPVDRSDPQIERCGNPILRTQVWVLALSLSCSLTSGAILERRRPSAHQSVPGVTSSLPGIIRGGPWTEPTYADSTSGDSVSGEGPNIRRIDTARVIARTSVRFGYRSMIATAGGSWSVIRRMQPIGIIHGYESSPNHLQWAQIEHSGNRLRISSSFQHWLQTTNRCRSDGSLCAGPQPLAQFQHGYLQSCHIRSRTHQLRLLSAICNSRCNPRRA
jgi:hypothetical protein